ncbi:ring canal kelch homolog [Anopheles nili]|uniref:ring canal kelch homolog n=1 Tax=Anopheles nili TaxID=185578 RepID=UPI00237BE9C8|nr:ring canal kelch homolog [Anopheles nili]
MNGGGGAVGGGIGAVGGIGGPVAGIPAVSNPVPYVVPSNQPQPGPSGLGSAQAHRYINGASGGGASSSGVIPPPPPSMLHSMQQLYHPLAYRNELYDRTAGYDVPRGRAGPGYYQNQPPCSGRYPNLHLDLNRSRYPTGSLSQRTPRQRSFDDTESYHYYRCQSQANGAKYDNLYERVREEPAYQNTGSFAPAANRAGLFGRFDVIGHGVGRIERHLSSSCGNIDHYSLGGHYAVLGHSHLGTVGHIRLNQPATGNGANGATGANTPHCSNASSTQATNSGKDSSSVNVKSFFSCLGGENSQSMNNLNKPSSGVPSAAFLPDGGSIAGGSGAGGTVSGSAGGLGGNGQGQGGSIMGGLASAAAIGNAGSACNGTLTGKSTGAIPKISRKAKQSQLADAQMGASSTPPSVAAAGGLPDMCAVDPTYSSAGRVSKPSLQWLLVNKWLPMWVGQAPPDYKFIDFNFMFSRNCDGCSSAGGSHSQQQQQQQQHQELVRYGTIGQADYIPPAREYPTMTGSYPRVLRNTPQLARLREHEYENVPLNDSQATSGVQRTVGSRATGSAVPLRARSESPRRAGADPLRTWAFNFENNSFRPARSAPAAVENGAGRPREVRRITDGTFGVRELQQNDDEKPGPSGLAGRMTMTARTTAISSPLTDRDEGRPSSASSSSDSDNFAMESLAAESGGARGDEEDDEEEEDVSSRTLGEGAPAVSSKDKEHVPSSSNDSSDSLNYDGPEPMDGAMADRSLSEDEVEMAAAHGGEGLSDGLVDKPTE